MKLEEYIGVKPSAGLQKAKILVLALPSHSLGIEGGRRQRQIRLSAGNDGLFGAVPLHKGRGLAGLKGSDGKWSETGQVCPPKVFAYGGH